MDAYSPEEAPLPSPQVHVPSSSPGYSLPIRAPLTIDSDSEFDLPINGQIYSRTSSFNSSSSIDISSYSGEHTSHFEEENEGFVAYPDEEIVIERSHVEVSPIIRPFVRYPETNYVKESSSANFGTKLSVPIAPLTRDCDSDSDSVDGSRWDDSGWLPADGIMQKFAMAPKVRSFSDDDDDVDDELQVDIVFSGDNNNHDIIGIENLNSVSTESVENEGCEVECSNEVVKVTESDASSFDLERNDTQAVSGSNNVVEIETINHKLLESDEPSFDSERIDAQIVLNSDSEVENLNSVSSKSVENENLNSVLTESVVNEGCEVDCLNKVVKRSESDASAIDLEKIDAHDVLGSNNEIEIKTIKETEQEVVSDALVVSNSDNEIEIITVNETEQDIVHKKEEETLMKMQRVRAKFLRLALREQLTTEVNGEGGNYKFDFDLTVLAIGKTGVGKSATINSIFGEHKVTTSAFDPGTTSIQEITGNVDGIQLRVIDTPGLKSSSSDRSYNLRILKSIKRFTRKHTPNVVLYVDRLDTRDDNDLHLLTLITSSLGPSVWRSCIIALTHASCDPPNESSFVVQRCRSIQEQIVSCGGDDRHTANPVWLVDNYPSYEHDIMDLDYGLKGLVCLDRAYEDGGCDQVPTFEPLSQARDVINHSLELKTAYFSEYSYRVKLVGTNHWFLGCRMLI